MEFTIDKLKDSGSYQHKHSIMTIDTIIVIIMPNVKIFNIIVAS